MAKGEGRSKARCFAYVAAFVVFQTAIILVFALTVMRIKSPKVRFNAVHAESLGSVNTTSTSFNMRLTTQFTVKNTNFGHFKYDNSTLTILYDGMPVGNAAIPKGRAKARKTQKLTVTIDISSDRLPSSVNLGNVTNSGVLMLSSQAKLRGKVELMKVMKKKKSGEMSCTMGINIGTGAVQDLKCK